MYGLRFAIRGFAACGLRFSVCGLRFVSCGLQFAFTVCSLWLATHFHAGAYLITLLQLPGDVAVVGIVMLAEAVQSSLLATTFFVIVHTSSASVSDVISVDALNKNSRRMKEIGSFVGWQPQGWWLGFLA